MNKQQQEIHQTVQIDRSVFQKSQEEKDALKDMKRKFKNSLQQAHGANWKQHLKPVKLT